MDGNWTLTAFFYDHVTILMAAALGLLGGGLIVGWLVRSRVKQRCEQLMADIQMELRLLQEKHLTLQEMNDQLRVQVTECEAETRLRQEEKEALQTANATFAARLQQMPALEKSLAEVRNQSDRLQAELRRESAALAKAQEKGDRLARVEEDLARKETQMEALQQQLSNSKAHISELSAILDEERKQAAEKIALIHQARDQLKNEFENLAQQIFEEKSHKFVDQNRTAVDQLIGPLRDQIGEFKRRVEDVYDKETRDRTALQAEIHHLKELNQKISKEAVNLTRALKGDSKARGNWGEVVLERVLEASGLQKGREYEVQVGLHDQTGRRYQPDAIVRLPEGKDVIVDAKVSLKAYEAYFNAESPQEREQFLGAHIDALRHHIRSLAGKRYDSLEGVRSPDFTLMFVPVEAAFLAAVERQGGLFTEAFEQNIVLVSPSTLLVTLRTIQNIWRHEYQNRHALEIATKAGGLYDKFVGFVAALEEVGLQLDRARGAYQSAYDRLVSGRGNLIRRAEQLKILGAKAAKALPSGMAADDDTHMADLEDDEQG